MDLELKETVLTTKLGKIQGRLITTNNFQQYLAFLNIPYAEPPIGELRFKEPEPVKPWSGILDGTVESDECYSKHQFYLNRVGSENCLKLNVFTKSTTRKQSVMVFIHGGGFVMGSNKLEMYGPDYFMTENIVLVTINYRLGIFGFLALEDKALKVPGNAGLKDQVMALKWIQNHIDSFGGDPNNVTIFGSSAGSASINYLLCSPMAEGLFHKVIMQSGSALNPWARGKGLPKEFLEFMNLTGKSDTEILKKLMECTKEELLDAQCQCKDPPGASDKEPFGPVIEGLNPFEPSLLLDDPLTIMKSGDFIKVPMIIGYNTDEGLLFDAMEYKYNVELTVKDFNTTVPWIYKKIDEKVIKDIGNKIKEFYFGHHDPTQRIYRDLYVKMQTDNFFLRGIYVTLKTILQSNSNPIYLYRFDFDGKLNGYKSIFQVTTKGSCHCDELFYMFKTTILPEAKQHSIENKTIGRLVKMWTQFAKTSNPSVVTNENDLTVCWPQVNDQHLLLLNIGRELQVIPFPESDRMSFWNSLDGIAKYNL